MIQCELCLREFTTSKFTPWKKYCSYSCRRRAERLRLAFRLTPEAYRAMRLSQSDLCLLCRERQADSVDHNHRTGEVRGLLCSQCNYKLGLVEHDPKWFERALDYLTGQSATKVA